jgi:predicted dehydrogenase
MSDLSGFRIAVTEGILMMDPAYTWHGDIQQTIIVKDKEQPRTFEHRDPVAAEILYFAGGVPTREEPEPSGREGLIDVRIIEALRTSCTEHRPVRMEPLPANSRPDVSQSIERSPPQQPRPVNAARPSQT